MIYSVSQVQRASQEIKVSETVGVLSNMVVSSILGTVEFLYQHTYVPFEGKSVSRLKSLLNH